MQQPNNILSYFIKDIKDPKECAYYKQMNITTNNIEIFYKDKIIYYLLQTKLKSCTIWNLKNNVNIDYLDSIINYKIDSNKRLKYKQLFYKNDNKIFKENSNYIYYEFIYNKYLNKYLIKKFFDYVIEDTILLCIKNKYYNRYIYKYISRSSYNHKYKHVQILIMNKYELHYINRFFSIYN
jgi:hypothetical protein